MSQLTFLDEGLIGQRHLHGIEVFALDILHQSHLHHLVVGSHTHIGRNLFETSQLGSAVTTLTGNELIGVVGHLAHRDGSNHTLLTDGLSQLFQRLGRKFLAGLEGIGDNLLEGYGTNGGSNSVSHLKILGIGQYRAQSATQSSTLLFSCHFVYLFLFLSKISCAKLR